MSEYASPDHVSSDDALLDRAVEYWGSYDEARRHLGLDIPEYETPALDAEQPGAFITLEDRAIAVKGLIEGICIINRAKGARESLGVQDSDFRSNSQHPELMCSGMDKRSNHATEAKTKHLDILNGSVAMGEAGFERSVIMSSRVDLKEELRPYEETGKIGSDRRRKLVTRVQKTVEVSEG